MRHREWDADRALVQYMLARPFVCVAFSRVRLKRPPKMKRLSRRSLQGCIRPFSILISVSKDLQRDGVCLTGIVEQQTEQTLGG